MGLSVLLLNLGVTLTELYTVSRRHGFCPIWFVFVQALQLFLQLSLRMILVAGSKWYCPVGEPAVDFENPCIIV